MKTRQQYLDGDCTHEEYYAQFVTTGIIESVKHRIGEQRILASTDEHLNDIPLSMWDDLYPSIHLTCAAKLKQAGDGLSLAGAVCIAKAAARKIQQQAA